MINIDALNDEEKLAALESIHKSIAESKEIQRKKITTNVEMIVKALKKIEADLKQRYDETGQLIANLKSGEDGRDGKDGKDGKNGKDGRDGPMGPRGYDGVPGRNGLDGTDGVSVTDAHIDFDGSLIISLSSGRVINVGEVVAADIAEKIKVITNGGGTSQSVLDAIASLQAQIDAIASGLEYQGTWNASTNTPTLASSVGTAGYYYIVATAGSTNLNGITDWQIGDWAVFNGSVWQKIDQSNLVTSVAGRTGAIVLTTADIGGLGTIATQAANNVSITGGSITGITDLAIADGGTGASTANAAFNALAPSQTGNSGKYLTTDGTDTSWATNPLGTVTSVSGTGTVNGLTLTGTVTTSGSLTLGGTLSGIANSALTNSSITINGSATSLGGSINVGTVTSVAATVPSFLSIGGSPVTSSGTLAITLSGTALPTTSGGTGLTSFTTNGVVYASSTSALATGSALTFDGSKLVNTGYNKSTYQVSTGGIGTFESSGGAYLSYLSGANIYSMSDGSGTEDILNLRASAHLFYINSVEQARLNSTGLGLGTNSPGSKLDVKGTLRLSGSTSGYVGLAPAASAGSTTYTLPSADGTANQALVTNGSGTLSWASTATGTVTSVGGTGTVSGISLSGTVTSSGNLTLGGTLDLSAYNGAGAFTTLSASGVATFSAGSAAAPAISRTGDTNTGIFFPAADTIAFAEGGTEVMRLDSSGSLGIGTTSPSYPLHVVRDPSSGVIAAFRGTSTSANSRVIIAGNSSGDLIAASDTSGNGVIYSDSSKTLAFGTNGSATAQMLLNTSGNLGLGVTPSAWLSTYKAFQNGRSSFVNDDSGRLQIISNAFVDSGGAYRYIASTFASLDWYISGERRWYTAPSGTSGNAITFTQAMTLDASGNLGVGVTNPSSYGKLAVDGNISMVSHTQTLFANKIAIVSSSGNMELLGGSANIVFKTGASNDERARIDSSGNFGIGTTPTVKLDVYRGSSGVVLNLEGVNAYDAETGIALSSGRAKISGFLNGSGGTPGASLRFFTMPDGGSVTERVRIDSNGNVGIGKTPTDKQLEIYGSSSPALRIQNSTTGTGGNDGLLLEMSGSNINFYNYEAGAMLFGTSATERARIDSSGNLMVGRTSLSSGNTGTILTSGGGITSEISFTGTNEIAVFNQVSTGTTQIDFRYQAVASGYIEWNSTTTSYITSSDYRLKNTIAPMTGALAKVALLKPCTYKWNANGSDGEGFIAHELAEVCPQAVSGEKDAVDKDGSPKYQGVDTSFLVATLTAAIQEQQAIIESLKARLDAANL